MVGRVMLLVDQAAARVALAQEMGRVPLRWIVSQAAAIELDVEHELHGVPIERSETRFGLELVCAVAE